MTWRNPSIKIAPKYKHYPRAGKLKPSVKTEMIGKFLEEVNKEMLKNIMKSKKKEIRVWDFIQGER